jgi:hypothetical protein
MTKRSAESANRPEIESSSATAPQRGMALGYLAMLPLLAAYEIALASGSPTRNVAEVLLSLPLIGLGSGADAVRRGLLVACAFAAAWSCFHSELGLFQRLWRVILEGAAFAAILGPVLILNLHWIGIQHLSTALRTPISGTVPRISEAARLAGGAAYEEIVFRIGVQSLCYLFGLRVLHFLSAAERPARFGAEVFSVLAAAGVFACAHLAAFTAPLGPGGEVFDAAIFTWRALSGILLSCIFRWRGPGVAAWTHGLFNLALFLGAGPDCFL